jgi:glycosyltransferase involved in cell wall biosynthesis
VADCHTNGKSKRRRSEPGEQVVLEARVVCGSGGGPDKTILNTPRFLEALGYPTLCAYLHPPDDPGFEQLRRKAALWAAPLREVPDRGPWDWKVIWQLLNICRKERVAIWHGHDYKSNALGLLLRRFWPMRLVTTVHGWVKDTRRTPLYYWIDRLCLPYYELVICVSQDLCERCLACGVAQEKCVLLENAIDTAEFSRRLSTREAKEQMGLAPERFVIGAVGRLSAEKGFDVLIRSTHHLLQAGCDVELRIVGEGDERSRLQALIDELGIGDRARLLGYLSDTRLFYQGLDVFALSSLREGLPNVVLEAMALNVPVVATNIAGVPRLVRDGENGLLVEPGNEQALAGAARRLMEQLELRDRLGTAGRATVETSYSFATRMQKMRELYVGLESA